MTLNRLPLSCTCISFVDVGKVDFIYTFNLFKGCVEGFWFRFMVFNATFNNISVLLLEETVVHGENHRPAQITGKLYNVVSIEYTLP